MCWTPGRAGLVPFPSGECMITVRGTAPTLFVRSIEETAAFYGLKLGFAVIYTRSRDVSLIVICRGGEKLCFREGGDSVHEVRPAGAPRWHACIRVPDADGLAAHLLARGVPLLAAPSDMPDGLRGFEVADPDGHILLFAHRQVREAKPAPEQRPAAKAAMDWLVQGWVWVEVASGALGAVA
jgi:catechol 2,3-dioxygenase-like lactoylglutathione lyase family enzyme